MPSEELQELWNLDSDDTKKRLVDEEEDIVENEDYVVELHKKKIGAAFGIIITILLGVVLVLGTCLMTKNVVLNDEYISYLMSSSSDIDDIGISGKGFVVLQYFLFLLACAVSFGIVVGIKFRFLNSVVYLFDKKLSLKDRMFYVIVLCGPILASILSIVTIIVMSLYSDTMKYESLFFFTYVLSLYAVFTVLYLLVIPIVAYLLLLVIFVISIPFIITYYGAKKVTSCCIHKKTDTIAVYEELVQV